MGRAIRFLKRQGRNRHGFRHHIRLHALARQRPWAQEHATSGQKQPLHSSPALVTLALAAIATARRQARAHARPSKPRNGGFPVWFGSMVLLGDTPLSLFDFVALAQSGRSIGLSDAARARIQAARRIVERYAEGDEPIYGLNTGLGGNLGFRLEREAIRAFQSQLVIGRNVGIGKYLPEAACRAALLSRIITMATGGSGISLTSLDLLIALFNAGVTPALPARGSISAADLGIAAHLGAVIIGRGEAWFGGTLMPGGAALAAAGLEAARLEPKDGLALCNHSSPSSGYAAIVLAELASVLALAASSAALAFQAYGGNPRIFDARLHAARPAGQQQDAAAMFRRLLAQSSIHEGARNVQDAISFRCLAPIFGAVFAAFAQARREAEIELNAASDTPLVLIEDGLMLSAPNFHTASLSLAFDTLAIALTQMAAASAQRIIKLMNPVLSGLPKYLSPLGGASAGFVPMQKAVSGLYAEIRLHAGPAGLDAMPVSDTVEDHAPLTLLAIRKLASQLEPLRLLLTIEALVAAQGAELRDGLILSLASRDFFGLIRGTVPMLNEDRETGPDVMALAQTLEQPAIRTRIARSLAGLDLPILAEVKDLSAGETLPS